MKSFSMNRTAMSALCGALLIFLSQALSAQGTNSPWLAYSAPEEGGFSTAKLNQAKAQFDSMSSPAFMVIHQGKVLVAWGDVSRRFLNHSMRKSLMSAMYGIYIEKGLIDLDKSLAELGIDDKLGLTDIEKQARVQDLITARSGIYHPAAYEPRSMKANRPQRGASRPGEKFNYNNWDFNTLLTILEQEARIKFFDEYYNQIANPLGMEDLRKQDMQYRYEPELSDHAAYLFKMSTRDLARFGQLYLDNGQWNNEQIIPAQWVKKSTAVFSDDLGPGFSNRDGYGYLWWVDLTSFGQTAYYASGLGGHRLYVLPESDMVIVHRVNSYLNMGERDENIKKLVSLVLDAQTGKSKPRPEVTPLQIDAPQMPSAAINENLMKSYHGHYTHPFFQAIEVYSDEGQLKIRGEILGTFNLYARDDSQFVVEDLPELPLSFAPATSEYPKGTAITLSDERRRPTRFILYY